MTAPEDTRESPNGHNRERQQSHRLRKRPCETSAEQGRHEDERVRTPFATPKDDIDQSIARTGSSEDGWKR